MRPANGIHEGREIWGDIRVKGRAVLLRVCVIIFTTICAIVTGKIIRAFCMNEVDFVKIRVWVTQFRKRHQSIIGSLTRV